MRAALMHALSRAIPPTFPGSFRGNRMVTPGRFLVATLLAGVLLAGAAGCGTSTSISDSKIVGALDLKQAHGAYEMGGDPFCTIDQLLNDSDEVDSANTQGRLDFVIASPKGDVGVLARRP